FQQWLSSLSSDDVQYVRPKGAKVINNSTVIYYNCSRSFMSRSNAKTTTSGKRLLKSQGSSKLNFNCTSQIKAVHEENKIIVTYYKTHYKHNKEIQHLRINEEDKRVIANKLLSGVSITKIVDQNRDAIAGEDLKRIHLLTRKDCQMKGRETIMMQSEKMNKENSYVLYYKQQGQVAEDTLLLEKDFCII
ncbi:hypothetical protein NQ315_011286, partial [Exocentrus adspersus]